MTARTPRSTTRRTLLLAIVAASLSLTPLGCGRSGFAAPEIVDRASRLDALPGRTLVIPLDESLPLWIGPEVRGRLDDGLTLKGRIEIVRVEVLPNPGDLRSRPDEWLPPAGYWSSKSLQIPFGSGATLPPGTRRVMLFEMPTTPRGKAIRVSNKTYALNWLPTPDAILAADEAPSTAAQDQSHPWVPTLASDGAVSPIFESMASPEAKSPIGRWRYRILADGLRPGITSAPAFDDATIEALAQQNEARWQVALARLWAQDPDLCLRVKQRLTSVVDFGGGIVAPAWPTDHEALDTLLYDILTPHFTPEQRARRVESWLDARTPFVAWVVDDAGTLEATSASGLGVVGLASFVDLPTLAWAAVDASGGTPELQPLQPRKAIQIRVAAARERDQHEPATPVRVGAGRWSTVLPMLCRRVDLKPPGLKVGPLLEDWTMDAWLSASPRTAPENWVTAAWLHRPAGERNFELFVECRVPTRASPTRGVVDSTAQDVVRVWLGPWGKPRSVLRVRGDGQISDEAPRPDLPVTPSDARVVQAADRWSFRLTIPPEAIEPDGTLRLGLTRTDAIGRRWAWPRAMMPWQVEPGRLAFNTRAWDGLDTGNRE